MTAYHVLKHALGLQSSRDAWEKKQERFKQIKDGTFKKAAKNKALKGLAPKRNETFCTDYVLFWGQNGVSIADGGKIIFIEEADLALAKLEGFDPDDPNWCTRYPILKRPDRELVPGTSLCTLGYSFAQV